MSVDFPRAFQIVNATDFAEHHPKCSYRIAKGGFLCDCDVLYKHPEYLDDELHTKDGEIYEQAKR
jgi:hypothetical protein